MMTRRTLLSAAASAWAAGFSRPLGLNLYTVRTLLANDAAATYKALGAAGITELELRPPNLVQHAAMIRDAGMKPVHMFIEPAIVTGAWEEWRGFMAATAAKFQMPAPPAGGPQPELEEMIELARKHGVKRIGLSMLLPGERERAVDRINAAAQTCAGSGVELYYHNHAFEFQGEPGKRYIDVLRRRLDPRVRMEIDVFWVAAGGDDPAKVLRSFRGRVRSVHLKDIARDAPRVASEVEMPPSAFKEAGAGRLQWRAILRAAADAGVEHYLIEQDFTPGDPLESVRRSVQFLRGVEL
jgi:hypothetical protein